MSVYSYLFRRKKYFYFKVRFKDKQYSRRIDEFGDRYQTVREAMFAESRFLKSLEPKQKRNKIYIYQIYDDFVLYLSRLYKPTTLNHLVGAFKLHIFPIVKDLCVKDFNDGVISTINLYIYNLGIRSKNHIISSAKNLVRFLVSYGVDIRPDSIQGGKSFTLVSAKITNFWTFEEFKQFINVVDVVFYKLLFSVLYYYGLRISELRGLTKECFTPYKLIIRQCLTNRTMESGQVIVSPKTASSVRSYDMFGFIYDMYLSLPKNNSQFVFASFTNSLAVGESSIRWRLDHYCKKSGVKHIKLHEFRHSCASLLINAGMDSLQVANWLGHANPGITLSIYSHLFENRKNDVFNFLNNQGTKKRTL